jgi:uncharacterized protein (TIGR00156 family)
MRIPNTKPLARPLAVLAASAILVTGALSIADAAGNAPGGFAQQPATNAPAAGHPGYRGGGFSGPGIGPSTAKQASSMWDDTPVTLEGYIVRSLGGDHYLFQDESGTITVEIDPECWQGLNVTPRDRVILSGEVDTEWLSSKVDVDMITLK